MSLTDVTSLTFSAAYVPGPGFSLLPGFSRSNIELNGATLFKTISQIMFQEVEFLYLLFSIIGRIPPRVVGSRSYLGRSFWFVEISCSRSSL